MTRQLHSHVTDIKKYLKNPIVFKLDLGSVKESYDLSGYLNRCIKGDYAYSKLCYSVSKDFVISEYRYYAFSDRIDAMQFSLAVKNAQEVKIWKASIPFTVFCNHE